MSRLPSVTSRELVAALLRTGFDTHHQSGSHLVLCHPTTNRRIHTGDVDRGLLKKILKQAGLTEDEFRARL